MRQRSGVTGIAVGLGLLISAAAAPLAAGTVFVPLAGDVIVNGTQYSSRIWVANTGGVARRYTAQFIPDNTDGTKTRQAAGGGSVGGQRNVMVTDLAQGTAGLLELSGAPQLAVSAQISAPSGRLVAANLPVISAANVFAAHTAIELQGLLRTTNEVSSLTLVNIGGSAAACTVTARRPSGATIATPVPLALQPLSQVTFPDALGSLGEQHVTGVRITATCNQPFYAFALVFDPAHGEAYLHPPAASADSTLAPPDPQASSCPPGATCFVRPGTFFTSTNAEPSRIYKFPVPAGQQFRRLETTFKFRHGGWNKDPAGIFTLVYINRNGQFRSNTYAVVDIAAGAARRVHIELTADLPPVGPPEGVQNERQKVLLTAGEIYDVRYVYDAENLRFHLTLTDSKGVRVVDLDKPLWSTTPIVVSKGSFWVQFSEPFGTSIHVPSIGWTHSDLVFALIP